MPRAFPHRRWVTVALVVASLALAGAPPAAAAGGDVYLRPDAPVAARVQNLLRRMTVEEKVGQLEQIAVTRLQGADCTWSVYGADAVHGHNNVLGATVFPHQIGLGASWDPALATAAARSTHRAVAATGVSWDFAPVADLARDQRWGRYYETYAEDPVLDGALAAGTVTGLQDGGRLAATVKHYAGYSEPTNGHDRVPADLSPRYLQDTILPSYKAAVDAGALTVMANSGAVNGIPVTSSRYLLTDVLRGQWHFGGVVVSDWNDVRNLQTAYHLAADYPGAIAIAVNAGIDLAMLPPDDRDFHAAALAAVNRGLIAVLVPPKRLVAFARVTLAAGQQRAVRLTFPLSRLALTPGDVNGAGTPRVAPGTYQLSTVDSATTTFTIH